MRKSLIIASALTTATGFTTITSTRSNNIATPFLIRQPSPSTSIILHQTDAGSYDNSNANDILNKAPTFNGQLTLPIKVLLAGLKNHKVAAVYAVLSTKSNAWKEVSYIHITRDLNADVQDLVEKYGTDQIKFVRALSFAYPQKSAMTEVGDRWRGMVMNEGGTLDGFHDANVVASSVDAGQEVDANGRTAEEKEELIRLMMETADFDDDDEFEFEDNDVPLFVDTTTTTSAAAVADASSTEETMVESPFDADSDANIPSYSTTTPETKLEFNKETIDKVLDEIRPYLISDGGNVSVHHINEETRSVYLTLEGACGSCPSSTVTMQMGIERVLKEHFENMGEVAQVEQMEGEGGDSDEGLTMEAVMSEVNRIKPAITAMGGVIRIIDVDPLGVVEVEFRGANKVQQGLELALRDVPKVKHVKFVN
jgi:Fe-S cluster biogenesis protein NfuA